MIWKGLDQRAQEYGEGVWRSKVMAYLTIRIRSQHTVFTFALTP